MAQQAQQLLIELGNDPRTDSIAQSAICAAQILAAATSDLSVAINWLTPQLEAWEQQALEHAQAVGWAVPTTREPTTAHSRNPAPHIHNSEFIIQNSASHLYDLFLHHYSKDNRKRGGVFFTPVPVANFIVAQIDRLLREECGLPTGLADNRVTIIDPACGTGVFLLAILDFLRAKSNDNNWLSSLLPRLIGLEILPPAAFLAKLNLTLKLAELNHDFQATDRIQILTGDALCPSLNSSFSMQNSSFPVLLGNPPFSSLSTNTNPWIARLVRGDDEIRGYVQADGQKLGERKTWLHDDYVKFIRLAQWHVEQADGGIVGYITNHGYLDNATFRLMRHELLRVFPHIEIVNLHGNRRSRGAGLWPAVQSGAGFQPAIPDENIFNLDQGTAISLLCRPPTPTRRASEGETLATTKYSELHGARDTKLATLASACPPSPVSFTPTSPDWLFRSVAETPHHVEYASGWSLADAMPINTTAPVTARDHFVVAFTREELIARLEAFRDLSIPDDEIRQRYFQRTRSARYQRGDTRSWKLSEARRTIAADADWQRHITRCLYRPFDWRYIFWHPALIDWPRTEVTRHLVPRVPSPESRAPLCLLARRQQLPTQPCTFFWIADCLPLDGVIRSDNRGSESLFPLYVKNSKPAVQPAKPEANSTWNLEPGTWNSNFAPAFIDQFASATQLTWLPQGQGDLATTFGPEDLLAYIYALFHSPTYREEYATELRKDFPKILPPQSIAHFAKLVNFGHELIRLHLLHPTPHSLSPSPSLPLPESLLTFHAGGYPALKKWLQPKHRSTTDPDYSRIAAAIARTQEIMATIDAEQSSFNP